MNSSSLKICIEAGIPSPREYRDALIHEWYLSPIHAEKLVTYILLSIKTKELDKRIEDGEFYIEDKKYSVVWIDRPTEVYNNDWALLSFRFCKYLQIGYVLVKVLKGNPELFAEVQTNKG